MIKGVIKITQYNYDKLEFTDPNIIYEIVEDIKEQTGFLTLKEYKNETQNCSIYKK